MKVGSLFAGYGGLDLALNMLFRNVETVWCSDIEPGPKAIIETRFPGVPNLGDITQIDWETVPDVDAIVGGSPCQDLSTAGMRAGMKQTQHTNGECDETRRSVRPTQMSRV